ncbi:hypothetical protein GQ42DRAFT_158812 [Ramicandelaber brevisporus]|nr:hypothetical protein GQ42DRAFT_158812 [Ramicandelaber brevisporus]
MTNDGMTTQVVSTFNLTYDLMWYLTEFFRSGQAVKAMCVNHSFHELFVPVIWRKIGTSYLTRRKRPISVDALAHYGHLVRQLIIDTPLSQTSDVFSALPNVLSVEFVEAWPQILSSGYLDRMRKLQKISLPVPYSAKQMLPAIVKWANNSSLSGCVETVEVHLQIERLAGWTLREFVSANGLNRFKIYLDVNGNSHVDLAHLQKISTGLYRLKVDYACVIGDRHAKDEFGLLIVNPSIVYPQLSQLTIEYNGEDCQAFNLSFINPRRFPSLQHLSLYTFTVRMATDPFILAAFTRTWPHLRCLELHSWLRPSALVTIALHSPSLTTLVCNCGGNTLDLAVLTSHFAQLVSLELLDLHVEYKPAQIGPVCILEHLSSLKLRFIAFTDDVYRFLALAVPNLTYIEIGFLKVSGTEYYNSAQLTSSFTCGAHKMKVILGQDDVREFMIGLVGVFGKLRKLDLAYGSSAFKSQVRKLYPHIHVL